MKLTKAIEIITLMGTPSFVCHTEDILAARKLLIEAGERILVGRNNPGISWNEPLPGETIK